LLCGNCELDALNKTHLGDGLSLGRVDVFDFWCGQCAVEDADIFNNLAYVYAREQCFELAFAAVENALSLQPKNKNYLASKQEIKTWKKNQQKSLCLAY